MHPSAIAPSDRTATSLSFQDSSSVRAKFCCKKKEKNGVQISTKRCKDIHSIQHHNTKVIHRFVHLDTHPIISGQAFKQVKTVLTQQKYITDGLFLGLDKQGNFQERF
jgi:hypothetical protein